MISSLGWMGNAVNREQLTLYRDIGFIACLVLLPTIISAVYQTQMFNELVSLQLVDEIIYICMIFIIIYRHIIKKKKVLYLSFIYFYIGYSVFLIFKNSLPITHVLQIFLTVKAFLAYFYFNTMPCQYKDKMIKLIIKFLMILFFISFVISIIEIMNPVIVHNITSSRLEYRGIFNVGISSFASSRVFFAEFLLVIIVLKISFQKKILSYGTEFNFKPIKIALIFFSLYLLLLATASRKEIVLGFAAIPVLALSRVGGIKKVIILKISFILLLGFAVFFIQLFKDINSVALSERYVRLYLLLIALNIFVDYFPFGSGPGTFGSTMSIGYGKVYQMYNVGDNILGFGGAARGPIYDMFLTSLLAEYGVGILIFIFFLVALYRAHPREIFLDGSIADIIFLKRAFFLMIFVFSIFTPVLTNWIGLVIFSILGLINEERD